ncbi:MAG: type II toxin-antitoxin system RelE/ParE family toxin [Acholeplasmataceae bacterium]
MYQVRFSERAKKSLGKMDKTQAALILGWIQKNIVNSINPKQLGKRLNYNLKFYYRFRIGNYRVIAEINEQILTIIIIEVGHRKIIYDHSV